VEAWTAPFGRDGKPEKAFLSVLTPAGERTLGLIEDPDAAAVTVDTDIAGARVRVASTAAPPSADPPSGGRKGENFAGTRLSSSKRRGK
jgi:hypothetical protein